MAIATVRLRTYSGEEKEVKMIGIFAETDQQGNVFYKTEAQDNSQRTAVSFIYDMDEAIEEFTKLMRRMLEEQTKKLKGMRGE